MSGPAQGTDDAQSLRAMQEAAWANKRAKGFNTTDVPLEFCLLTGEVAEAFEAWRRDGDVGDELADVVIYAAGLASILSMDLEAEVARKLGVNAARVYERRPDGTVVKREGGLEPPRERARRPG
jgi:NTP pyrophosphatase (non-canonical NTP hydrolase)